MGFGKWNRIEMKPLNLAIVLIVLITNRASSASGEADVPRQTVSLDCDWRFHLGGLANAISPSYNDHDC
jgi:hypothetical protein